MKIKMRLRAIGFVILVWLVGMAGVKREPSADPASNLSQGKDDCDLDKIVRSEVEWRKLLAPEQYHILREKGTERAFSGEYDKLKDAGIYRCGGCDNPLFSSNAKFDSGTGWPSFYQPIAPERILTEKDRSWFATRIEVLCARCGSHLGHVFDDGPPPTGLRYCMNSLALKFHPGKSELECDEEAVQSSTRQRG